MIFIRQKFICSNFENTSHNCVDLVYRRGIHRGSYMSANVLLNLLNELGKRDKMQGLPSILSLFCNKFIKFNNTRAGI